MTTHRNSSRLLYHWTHLDLSSRLCFAPNTRCFKTLKDSCRWLWHQSNPGKVPGLDWCYNQTSASAVTRVPLCDRAIWQYAIANTCIFPRTNFGYENEEDGQNWDKVELEHLMTSVVFSQLAVRKDFLWPLAVFTTFPSKVKLHTDKT